MATITPKEKDGKIIAYKFRTCVGRDENGRQVSRATTCFISKLMKQPTAGGGILGQHHPGSSTIRA